MNTSSHSIVSPDKKVRVVFSPVGAQVNVLQINLDADGRIKNTDGSFMEVEQARLLWKDLTIDDGFTKVK